MVSPPKSRRCDTPDRLPHPCDVVCAECGRLETVVPASGDPMRRSTSTQPLGSCPHCHARSWVDVGLQSVALAYQEFEATECELHESACRRRGWWVGLSVGLLYIYCVMMHVQLPVHIAAGDMLPLLSLAFGWMAYRGATAVHRRTRPGRARPRRWRRPSPRPMPEGGVGRVRKTMVEGHAGLRTPLGDEPCVGWVVRVWSGGDLLLDEQRHGPLEIDGEPVEPDTLTLDLAVRTVPVPAPTDPAFVRFMRQRGLSPHDEGLRIAAARLLPGVPVSLHHRPEDGGVRTMLTQAPRSASH